MKRLILLLAVLVAFLAPGTQAAPLLQYEGAIASPRENAVLRGQVSIDGTANHPEFWKYEVRVTPGLNPNVADSQWVRVAVREQPVTGGQLAVWDTTSVQDGAYILRLRVVRRDGNWQDFDVLPVNVANRAQPTAPPPPPTPTLAATPTPDADVLTPTPAVSPTPAPAATLPPSGATPSPGNEGADNSAAVPLPTSPTLAEAATPIIIDQPTITIATPSVEAAGSAGNDPSAPTGSNSNASSDLPSLPTGLSVGLDLSSLGSACFTGAAFTAGVFLLVGMLFLLKSLFRLFR